MLLLRLLVLLLLFCQVYVEVCSFCGCGYGVKFDDHVEMVEVWYCGCCCAMLLMLWLCGMCMGKMVL